MVQFFLSSITILCLLVHCTKSIRLNDCSSSIEFSNLRTIPSLKSHSHTIIWLHGLGDPEAGWYQTLYNDFRQKLPHFKFILPVAPKQKVTAFYNQKVVSWFDFEIQSKQVSCFQQSYDLIWNEIIEKELDNGLSLENIIIGGFSQGGAMSLYFAQKHGDALCGIIDLSGFLLDNEMFVQQPVTPIFIGHGMDDDRVDLEYAITAHDTFTQEKYVVSKNFYAGVRHYSSRKMMADVLEFIQRILRQDNRCDNTGKTEL